MEHIADVVRRALVDAQAKMDARARVTRHEATAALNKALTSKSYNELNACEDAMCDYQIALGAEYQARKALDAHDDRQRQQDRIPGEV